MSAILPPQHRIWWKQPVDRIEIIWVVIAFVWLAKPPFGAKTSGPPGGGH